MGDRGFLIDENIPPVIARQLRLHEPEIPVMAVGQEGAPPKGTLDPDLLGWLEEHNYLLVTNNRASMPGHLLASLWRFLGQHLPQN